MQEFTDKLKDWMKETGTEIEEYVGELRNGNDYDLLKGTLSSRVYLKQDNARLQNKVENIIEPLYTLAELKGHEGHLSEGVFNILMEVDY